MNEDILKILIQNQNMAIKIKVEARQAYKEIKRIKDDLKPLNKEIVQRISLKDKVSNKVKAIRKKLQSINKKFEPVIKAKDKITGFLKKVKGQLSSLKKVYNFTIGSNLDVEEKARVLKNTLGKEKGKEALAFSSRQAVKTPFNEGQILSIIKSLNSSKLDYQKYFKVAGDLASFRNNDPEIATDFLGSINQGNFNDTVSKGEKLGISKEDWQKAGIKVGQKGNLQTTNQKQILAAVESIMKTKNISGSMDRKSNSATSMIDNIKESVQLMGRRAAGIKNNGDVVPGGMFDTFKQTLKHTLELLAQFSNSKAFKNLQTQITNLVSVGGEKLNSFLSYLTKNPEVINQAFKKIGEVINFIKPVFNFLINHTKLVLGAFLGFKVILPVVSSVFSIFNKLGFLKKIIGLIPRFMSIFKTVFSFLKTSLFSVGRLIISGIVRVGAFLIANPVIAGIMLVIGIIILLKKAWENNWGGIQDKTHAVIEAIKVKVEEFKKAWDGICTKISEKYEEIKKMWESAKEFFEHPIKGTIEFVQKKVDEFFDDRDEKKGKNHAVGIRYVPRNNYKALLHEGERVLTKQENLNYNKTSSVNVNVSNLVVRKESDINVIAKALAREIQKTRVNVA